MIVAHVLGLPIDEQRAISLLLVAGIGAAWLVLDWRERRRRKPRPVRRLYDHEREWGTRW